MKQPHGKPQRREAAQQATINVRDLRLRTFIGFNPEEMVKKQDVVINLEISYLLPDRVLEDQVDDALNYKTITKRVIQHVEEGRFLLLEKLVGDVLAIKKIDHIGIRVREKQRAIDFYQLLGFRLITDIGFEKGHPVIMEHPSGVVINVLGPASEDKDENVLMDIDAKHAGITHVALRVESLPEAEAFLNENGIAITGRFSFKDLSAMFIRDPDRNVIELDAYPGGEPATREDSAVEAWNEHP